MPSANAEVSAPANLSSSSSWSVFSMLAEVSSHAISEYKKSLNTKVMMIDAFMAFSASNVLIQCVYVLFVGTFPFNSFLAGVFCNLGMFVLAASLRLQCTSVEFKNVSSERAFGDFVLCSLVLFFVVFSFLG